MQMSAYILLLWVLLIVWLIVWWVKWQLFCLKIQGFEFLIGDHVIEKKEIACFQMTQGKQLQLE